MPGLNVCFELCCEASPLSAKWKDYEAWQKRDLGNRRFLYIWADGVYFKPRMAEEK